MKCLQWREVSAMTWSICNDVKCLQWRKVSAVTWSVCSDIKCLQWRKVSAVSWSFCSFVKCLQWREVSAVTWSVCSDVKCLQWHEVSLHIFPAFHIQQYACIIPESFTMCLQAVTTWRCLQKGSDLLTCYAVATGKEWSGSWQYWLFDLTKFFPLNVVKYIPVMLMTSGNKMAYIPVAWVALGVPF